MTAAEDKKKVLIVSFYFPPENIIPSIRIGKFAKCLPEFGWEPIVLTVDRVRGIPQTLPVEIDEANIVRTSYFDIGTFIQQRLSSTENTSLQTQAGGGKEANWKRKLLKVIHLMRPIYTVPLFQTLLLDYNGWYPYGVKRGLQIIAKHKIDAIFSSYSPSVSHFIASTLNRKAKIPWIAEFRDPWTLNPYLRKIQPFQLLEEQLERRTMRNATLLVAPSDFWANRLESFHSIQTVTIPNGFDEEDYLENVPLTTKFTITYTGKVYHQRDPTPLFEAVAALKQEGSITPDDLEICFFGSDIGDMLPPLVEKYGLHDYVKMYGFIPFKESIRKQKESSVLLLLSWNDPRDEGTLTAKVFEYMGARRPILALGFRGGAIDKLLREGGCGILANEASEIKSILIKWLEEFKKHGEITSFYYPDEKVIKNYTRREQTRKLAEVFNGVVNQFKAR